MPAFSLPRASMRMTSRFRAMLRLIPAQLLLRLQG
jgi:hypothetical protein